MKKALIFSVIMVLSFMPTLWAQDAIPPQNGEYKTTYPNGTVKEILFYKNGQKEGVSKLYYDNGQLMNESIYRNGELNGLSRDYLPDGKLKAENNFRKGALHGMSKSYFDTSELLNERTYKNGEVDGAYLEYYKNGNLMVKAQMKNSKYDGEFKRFYEDGQLMYLTSFINGKTEGFMKHYHENGQLIEEHNLQPTQGSEKNWVTKLYRPTGELYREFSTVTTRKDNGEWFEVTYEGGKLTQEIHKTPDGTVISKKNFDANGNEIQPQSPDSAEVKTN